MTDREALYRAIIANPDEDTPRFVFADWLEEHDEPEHAEFIRIGCQLEANTPDHPDYVEWLTRQEELTCWLATHSPGPQPKFPAGLEVSGGEGWWRSSRRGFPRYVEFDGNHHHGTAAIRALAKSLEKAFASLPTRWLAVRFITNEQLAELLRQPILSQLDSLTLQLYERDEPNDEAAQLVAECPHLKNLRGLNLGFDFGDVGAEALGQSEHLRQLERLTIQCDWRILTKKWFPNLRELDLGDIVAAESFEQLCALDPFPRLHTLTVPSYTESWETFAKSNAFPALARLGVKGGAPIHDRMPTLLGAKWFRPTVLTFDFCSIHNDGALALASSSLLDSVRWLRIRYGDLNPSGAAALASSKELANLKHLDLSFNNIGAAGLRAIAKNPALRGLLSLNVSGQPASRGHLTPEYFHEFLSTLDMPQLRYLSLRGRPVGPKAIRLLADQKFASLRRLDLGNCGLTDAAVKALLEAPALQNLVELRLDGNNLKSGVAPLIDPNVMPRLGACYLNENRLGDELSEKLRKRPGMKV
jgi:uncharacterized protein (TIGR02996 family)